MAIRDEFPKDVVATAGRRANYVCSNPECRTKTTGPHSSANRAVNIGVAAHITAAAPGGPRYDPLLTPEARRSPENGIWLCQNCAKRVDSDPGRFPASLLRVWKAQAEGAADRAMGQPSLDVDVRDSRDEVGRARLRDERIQRILRDWPRSGNAVPLIETFSDLSTEEKAELYDTVYALYKKGRRLERNPFRA